MTELPHCGRPEPNPSFGEKKNASTRRLQKSASFHHLRAVKFARILSFERFRSSHSYRVSHSAAIPIRRTNSDSHHELGVKRKKKWSTFKHFSATHSVSVHMRVYGACTDTHTEHVPVSPYKPPAIMNGNQSMSHRKINHVSETLLLSRPHFARPPLPACAADTLRMQNRFLLAGWLWANRLCDFECVCVRVERMCI